MLNKIEEEEPNNDIELSDLKSLQVKSDTTSSIVSNDILDRDLDEDEEDDNDFSVKITQETFIFLLEKGSDALMVIGIFLLICFWISDSLDYNFFPFDVNKASNLWYQFAQLIFLASYWTTKILLLRILGILGYLFFIIWSISVGGAPSIDFYLFTYINILINFKKIIELLYKKRPIIFDDLREQIYVNTFEGFMDRNEYKELINTSLIRELPRGGFYCKIKDRCNNLSLLIKGRIRVFKNNENIKTTFINENEFIDSAEWLLKYQNQETKLQKAQANKSQSKLKMPSRKPRGRRFNYFMKADDECIYLTWPREILREQLKLAPELEQKLNGALGIDVSYKLFNNSFLY